LTTGGRSYPGSGTTGDGYRIASRYGHTIVTPRPALTPVRVAVPWVAELRGVTVPDVAGPGPGGGRGLAAPRCSVLFGPLGALRPVGRGGVGSQPGPQRPSAAR